MQNQLGLSSYLTAWMSCAKLRRAMVNRKRCAASIGGAA
jgi:hypothetical protein